MIKITKPGQKEFHGFCKWCGCEFTYEISDLKLSATSDKVSCPTCGKDYHHPSMVQDPTIPGGIGRLQTWPPDPIPCTPDMTKTDPCAGCVWRENLLRDGVYIGDTPCTWCNKNQFNKITCEQPSLNDYTTLCGTKTPDVHLTGKECNCGPNAVCSKCSGGSNKGYTIATSSSCAVVAPDNATYKTDVSACDGCVATCPTRGDVWKTITDCCNNCATELNEKQSKA